MKSGSSWDFDRLSLGETRTDKRTFYLGLGFLFVFIVLKCHSDLLEGWTVELLKNYFVGKRPWDMSYPVNVCDV